MKDRLLTVDETGEILGIKPKTIYQWSWLKKHLSFVKVGKALRISESDLEKFIKENRVKPKKLI